MVHIPYAGGAGAQFGLLSDQVQLNFDWGENLAEAADDNRYDDEVRASHAEAINLVGEDVGTPVIAVPGAAGENIAFFGPVVTPAPKGEAAGRLWDGTLLVAGTPGFFEIKRTRSVRPDFS